MTVQKKAVLVRLQPAIHEKFKYISEKNHRSVSNQLEWLMIQFIGEYESKNGQISLQEQEQTGQIGVVNNNVGGTNFLATGGTNNYRIVST